jgi:hypothetical protein
VKIIQNLSDNIKMDLTTSICEDLFGSVWELIAGSCENLVETMGLLISQCPTEFFCKNY